MSTTDVTTGNNIKPADNPQTFFDTLRRCNAGNTLDDATRLLAELVQTVDSTGKPGSLTLTISLRKAASNALAIKGKVSVKKPAEPEMEALLFPTVDGALLTEDPAQRKLELKPVAEEAPRTLKAVS